MITHAQFIVGSDRATIYVITPTGHRRTITADVRPHAETIDSLMQWLAGELPEGYVVQQVLIDVLQDTVLLDNDGEPTGEFPTFSLAISAKNSEGDYTFVMPSPIAKETLALQKLLQELTE